MCGLMTDFGEFVFIEAADMVQAAFSDVPADLHGIHGALYGVLVSYREQQRVGRGCADGYGRSADSGE